MKPIKNLEPISLWILRFGAAAFALSLYFSSLKTLNFASAQYIINFVYCLFFVLLFAGGFQKGHLLTIVSGLVVGLISAYKCYWAFGGSLVDSGLFSFVTLAGIGFFFASRGNS